MNNFKNNRIKVLFNPNEASLITRRKFLRSVSLGGLGLGLSLTGYSKDVNPLPVPGKLLPGRSKPPISKQPHYYGHDAVLDTYGVIAPWYHQPNGQCDFRVRIASETLKRYPWTTTDNSVASYPHYLFSGMWGISSDGIITPKDPGDWMNGDFGQRCFVVLKAMVEYYRYSGDPAAIAHLTYMGNYLLDYCLTPSGHPWPDFPISVPVKGKPYGKPDPGGMIQLDICASIGEGLLRAYQITKNQRWFDSAKHWGDLFAEKCNKDSNGAPWPRYANPENTPWKDDPRGNLQTGGVTIVLSFLDELIRLGYSGKNQQIELARDSGIRYLRDKLLPEWSQDTTWGYYYWDGLSEFQTITLTVEAASYIIRHKELFPNWRNDSRNILMIFLNRSSADPKSSSDVFNGAWAYPESRCCCWRSLWYAPLVLGGTMAHYGVVADDSLMRELSYRQFVLLTYDGHENGVTEDNIDGGFIVNKEWFQIAHPLPLLWILQTIGWLPEELGPSRENHIVRSSSVVDSIIYGKGVITYTTFDSPPETVDVLRLSYVPEKIFADGKKLSRHHNLEKNGYVIKKLPNGDAIVWIRHDGKKSIILNGSDPQTELKNTVLHYEGTWTSVKDESSISGSIYSTDSISASITANFYGNQVRVIGPADQFGGQAEVIIDSIKQSVLIDFWNPEPRSQQTLYYKNGLESGKHTLKIIAIGNGNPYSQGRQIYIDAILFSAESSIYNFPSGTGPTGPQRMIFGYTKREDYKDTYGHLWRPAGEVVTRFSEKDDTIEKSWWLNEAKGLITGTPDPELYRYGCHASDFWVNVTVGPGEYDVRLKFAVTDHISQHQNCFDIIINERTVADAFNVFTAAGGSNKAVDLVFKDIEPQQGVIQIRFKGLPLSGGSLTNNGEAFIQALEIGQKLAGKEATYKTPI